MSGRYPNPQANRYPPSANIPHIPNGTSKQVTPNLPPGQQQTRTRFPTSNSITSSQQYPQHPPPSSLPMPQPTVPSMYQQTSVKTQIPPQRPVSSAPQPHPPQAQSRTYPPNVPRQSTAPPYQQYQQGPRAPPSSQQRPMSNAQYNGGQYGGGNVGARAAAPTFGPPMPNAASSMGNGPASMRTAPRPNVPTVQPPASDSRRMRPVPPGVAPASAMQPGVNAAAAGIQTMNIGARPKAASGYPRAGAYPQAPGAYSGVTGILPETVKLIPLNDPATAPRPKMDAESTLRRISVGDEMPTRKETANGTMSSHLLATPEQKGARAVSACSEELFVPCSQMAVRLSIGSFPSSAAMAKKYALPLGAVIQPLAKPLPGEKPVPVINFGSSTGIVRCRRCRTYINFACTFLNGGRRWSCSICHFVDDVSPDYYSPVDVNGRRQDAAQRPELTHGTVEFVAPSEYMVRPPMPATFIFVLEVTPAAVVTGALSNMIAGIRRAISKFSGDGREKVALITYDSTVHFHSLRDGANGGPSVTIVADIDDMFLPTPDNLLVPLVECKSTFERILDLLPKMYAPKLPTLPPGAIQGNPLQYMSSASCLGAAIVGGHKVVEHWGGKMILFAASRPTVGPGPLRERGDISALGTDRELGILKPEKDWYRSQAVAFTKVQLACDIYVATPPPGAFMDVGTFVQLAKYTGGHFFYSPSFDAVADGPRLQSSVYRNVMRETGLEAVMRIRISRGLRCAKFSGRFFLRSSDLMALPSCDEDKAYGVQFAFDESELDKGPFCMQVALLYTTTSGERRIRVHTAAVPVSNMPLEIYTYTDAATSFHLLMRQASEAVKNRRLEEIKKTTTDKVVSSLAWYKKLCATQYGSAAAANPGSLLVPESMSLMPLYLNGMLKNRLLNRTSTAAFSMRFDDLSSLIHETDVMNVSETCAFLYPNTFMVYPTPQNSVKEGESLPEAIPPSMRFLKSDAGVLIDDGTNIFLWLGGAIYERFAAELMGNLDLRSVRREDLEAKLTSGRTNKNPQIAYISEVIAVIRARRGMHMPVRIVIAGSKMHAMVEALMMEDRTASSMGFIELLRELQRQISTTTVK